MSNIKLFESKQIRTVWNESDLDNPLQLVPPIPE